MRRLAVLVVVLGVPAVVRADAIMPFEGACPPGLRKMIVNHAEACEPITCRSDGDCGSGAACRDIGRCWAPREYDPSGGRLADAPTEIRDLPIGPCRADGTCAEGTCRHAQRCEPTGSTPAWDPAARRWTGEPHRAGMGCAIGQRGGAGVAGVAWAIAIGLLGRRRGRR